MEQTESKRNYKKIGINLLKLISAVVILYAVYSKIPLEHFQEELAKLSWYTIVFSILLLALSMFFSAVRLTYLIRDLGINISLWTNSKLYLLGMFYNLFIPGGVGGDAYKIFYLNKKHDIKTKESFWPLLIDRGSGLFSLLVLILVCAYFIDITIIEHQQLIITALIIFGFIAITIIIRIIRKAHLKTFFITLPLSFLTQSLQAACVYLFIHAIGVTHHTIEYFLLFFVSSIATIIPITPGGIGLRELTYKFGSPLLDTNPSIGAFVATLFFIVTLFVSFFGIYYHFRGIDKKEKQF